MPAPLLPCCWPQVNAGQTIADITCPSGYQRWGCRVANCMGVYSWAATELHSSQHTYAAGGQVLGLNSNGLC